MHSSPLDAPYSKAAGTRACLLRYAIFYAYTDALVAIHVRWSRKTMRHTFMPSHPLSRMATVAAARTPSRTPIPPRALHACGWLRCAGRTRRDKVRPVPEQRPGNDTNFYVFVTCAEALRDSEDVFSFASNERFHRTSMGWEASEISDAQLPAGCSVQQSSRHACVPAALRHILCLHRRPCGDPCSVVKENHASYIYATPSPLTDGDTDRCRCSNPIPHSNTPACSACVRVASLCG